MDTQSYQLSSNASAAQRQFPHNLEVERQIIGAILLDREPLARAQEKLKDHDFYLERHQVIYSAISEMSDQGLQVDLLTLQAFLEKKAQLQKAGGPAYLMEIASEVVTWANIEQHAEIIREKAIVRKVIEACNTVLEESYKGQMDATDLLDYAESSVYKISEAHTSMGFSSIQEIFKSTFTLIESYSSSTISGVPSGYIDLDNMTAGWQPTDLIILAARPSVGKTALTLNFMTNAALYHKKSVAFFSLEMGKEQLVQRILCREAKINQQLLRQGKLPRSDLKKLIDAATALHSAKIYIDDSSNQTSLQIRSKCRRLKATQGLDMIIIDYLQLMSGSGKLENRQQEISQISRSLKGLAKELQIPVIALSQLSRQVENRGADAKPMLSDLRESGAIEQDADIVAFINRPGKDSDDPELKNMAEVIIAKQRNGPIGNVRLTFRGEWGLFENYSARTQQDGTF